MTSPKLFLNRIYTDVFEKSKFKYKRSKKQDIQGNIISVKFTLFVRIMHSDFLI